MASVASKASRVFAACSRRKIPALLRHCCGLVLFAACISGKASAADLPAPDQTSPFNAAPSLIQPRATSVLPADSAFALSALVEAENAIVLMWDIVPGYYLYRKSLQVETADGSVLSSLELPAATPITDEFFGEVDVYYERLLLRIPLQAAGAKAGESLELLLTYQGCAEGMYCYPPQQKAVTLALPE